MVTKSRYPIRIVGILPTLYYKHHTPTLNSTHEYRTLKAFYLYAQLIFTIFTHKLFINTHLNTRTRYLSVVTVNR